MLASSQDVHQRLAFGPHPGGGDPLAELSPGQRAIGGQRGPHGGHRPFRVLRRHALLRQPAEFPVRSCGVVSGCSHQ